MLELVIYDISTITLDVVIAGMFFFLLGTLLRIQ